MTGEVTLRGRVLPIGGLKEKLLAALRGGIETVLIPKENEKDLAEIPANIREGLKIVPVEHVDEVLRLALTGPLEAIDWTEADELAAHVRSRAERITTLSPQAARLNKQTLRALKWPAAPDKRAQAAITNIVNGAYDYADSAEHREGIEAFIAKRSPRF